MGNRKMEFRVLDSNLIDIDILDKFESAIWTERYFGCGDFEIKVPASQKYIELLKADCYLWRENTDVTMIIEDIRIESDVIDGNELYITGRSLESILERRIIWGQTNLDGNLQDGIEKLINESIIAPSIEARKIPNFIFKKSDDKAITDLKVEAQFFGENLYTAIQTICESKQIGFKVRLTEENQFEFSLYSGVDRSYDQEILPRVIFSADMDNVISSNYIESKKTYKTVTLVAGEGEGNNRKLYPVELESGGGNGLSRRELFTDAAGVSKTVDGGTLTEEQYEAQLKQKGVEELSKNDITKTFEGEMETVRPFTYGEDFFMGDIVHITNEYGIDARSRIVELVESKGTDGVDTYPTFSTIYDDKGGDQSA